jgi:hypothetical protein
MSKKKSDESHVVLYHTPDGKVTVGVTFARENFWMTQKAMTDLFGVNKSAISKHLKKIFDSGELLENSVVSILETTAADGKQMNHEPEHRPFPTRRASLSQVRPRSRPQRRLLQAPHLRRKPGVLITN